MKKLVLTLLIAILYAASGFSQNGIVKTMYSRDSIVTFRVFDTKMKKIEASKSKETLREFLHARNEDELVLQARTDELSYNHYF